MQGWLYLACVTDVYSRMVLGWSMASHRKSELVIDAVVMAVHRRGGAVPGVIHHSDRGAEYGSHALERELRRHGALASMGSVADCYDWPRACSRRSSASCSTSSPAAGSTLDARPSLPCSTISRPCHNPRRRHSALGQLAPQPTRRGMLLQALRPDQVRSHLVSTGAGQLQSLQKPVRFTGPPREAL